ncbi:SpoIVB peptidase [bacterium 1xD8-6]|jgi:stage IV sporulation protein B|nr:SpoIVB peptidase [bacterium D16-36]RKI73199.1 SpoIVB peptidase [bacterium 1xD8-6]
MSLKCSKHGRSFFSKINWRERDRKIYRLCLILLVIFNLGAVGAWYWQHMDSKVPDHIYLFQNQNVEIDFSVPLEGHCQETKDVIAITNGGKAQEREQSFGLDRPVSVMASSLGSYQAELKLFGIFHYKYIHFDVIEEAKVMPSGKAVGLYIQSDGIMVLGTSKIIGKDGFTYEPAKEILQPGDVIYKVEEKQVGTIDQVVELLQREKRRKVTLEVMRGGTKIQVKLDKILAKDGEYKIGVWLREDTEGIGTLSFVTENNQFAALGHGITDIDTGKLIKLSRGSVYPAKIEDIKKGKAGSPGELIGSVSLGDANCIGKIGSNTTLGITGSIDGKEYTYRKEKALPVGLKQDVHKGKAWIMCQIGEEVEKFEVEIEEINVNSRDNKGMVIRVTDRALLKRSGGIVQGMSGAPVIQNDKVVGAITHVFVNDPTGGYATFMENMI